MKFEIVLFFLALSLVFFSHSSIAAPSLETQRLFEEVEKTLSNKMTANVSEPSRDVASQMMNESDIMELDELMDGRVKLAEKDEDESMIVGDQE